MTSALSMPGLKCALGQQFLGKDNAAAVDHYVSVLRTLSKDSQVCYHGSMSACVSPASAAVAPSLGSN